MNKYRRDAVDYDYVNKLDDESLEFLEQFTDEYYHNNFIDKKEDIHGKYNEIYEDPEDYKLAYDKRKYVKKKNPDKKLDTYTKVRRELYRQNKARQHCIYNLSKAGKRLDYIHSLEETFDVENDLNLDKVNMDELFMLALENGYVDTYSEFVEQLEESSRDSCSDTSNSGNDD